MIKSIIKLGLLLVAGILVYNFFFGEPAEKENAQKIFGEVRDLGVAVKDLLKSEKDKFDAGKYDTALEKVGNMFDKMKTRAEQLKDSKLLDEIAQLEKKRQELTEKLNDTTEKANDGLQDKGAEAGKELNRELEDLMRRADSLVNKMDEQ